MLERLLAPRLALTAAEFLAFRCGMHVLVVLTDMSSYVDAWSTSRGDPRARGLHGELAGLYERAGCVEGSQGSITLVPVITMPNDDVAHRIPQAMGHVTEGQIVLDRHLHRRGVYPPINLRHSLSHLMRRAVGREDAFLSDQLCATYAAAKEVQLWRIVAVTEEEEDQSLLSSLDLVHLDFLDRFEYALVDQGRHEWRGVGRSFDIARSILRLFPREALRHLPDHIAARLYDLD